MELLSYCEVFQACRFIIMEFIHIYRGVQFEVIKVFISTGSINDFHIMY